MKRIVFLCLVSCLTGILFLAAVAFAETGTVYVKGTTVNIRAEPSTESAIVTRVHRGDRLTTLETGGDWYRVLTPDAKEGWIYRPLTTDAPTTAAKGIGISRDQLIRKFSEDFPLEKSKPVGGETRYMGVTSDNTATLEIIGPGADVSAVTMLVGIPSDSLDLAARNVGFLTQLLVTIFPGWDTPFTWVSETITSLAEASNPTGIVEINGKTVKMSVFKDFGIVTLTVKKEP